MITVKDFLSTVYKASQCTDTNDCRIALKQVEDFQRSSSFHHRAIDRRIRTLRSRLWELERKEVRTITFQQAAPSAFDCGKGNLLSFMRPTDEGAKVGERIRIGHGRYSIDAVFIASKRIPDHLSPVAVLGIATPSQLGWTNVSIAIQYVAHLGGYLYSWYKF